MYIHQVFRFVTYTCCYFRTFIPDLPQHLPTFTRQTGRDVRTGNGSLNLVGVRGNEKRTARVSMVTMILSRDVTNHEKTRGE